MSNTHTTTRLPKELQRRLSKEGKLKTPRTSANALANYYIETGLTADEAKRKGGK